MNKEQLITIEEFSTHYKVESSFIHSLAEFGLIEIITIEEMRYLPKDQISEVEKMIRMHYELDINLEGIEAISHLLQRISRLQEELTTLKNRFPSEEI
jgi:chaperone modulatory protein CbpM